MYREYYSIVPMTFLPRKYNLSLVMRKYECIRLADHPPKYKTVEDVNDRARLRDYSRLEKMKRHHS